MKTEIERLGCRGFCGTDNNLLSSTLPNFVFTVECIRLTAPTPPSRDTHTHQTRKEQAIVSTVPDEV
jgi:hypothetical protein